MRHLFRFLCVGSFSSVNLCWGLQSLPIPLHSAFVFSFRIGYTLNSKAADYIEIGIWQHKG